MTKEETLVMLEEAKESVDDASNVTDQLTREFAIHATNATLLHTLTTANCCASYVQNKKTFSNELTQGY
jgi:hypothetical protein